jgi:L-asparaginase
MKAQKDHIHLITMGGTIDFIDPGYDYLNEKIIKINRTVEDYLINIANPHHKLTTQGLIKKDSRDITLKDRELCVEAIKSSVADFILITHGTYTMNTTGIYIQSKASEFKEKTIILTGSMMPLWGFMTTDASYNLGFATASFKFLSPGVYISMNAENFDPKLVHKDLDNLSFEAQGSL